MTAETMDYWWVDEMAVCSVVRLDVWMADLRVVGLVDCNKNRHKQHRETLGQGWQ